MVLYCCLAVLWCGTARASVCPGCRRETAAARGMKLYVTCQIDENASRIPVRWHRLGGDDVRHTKCQVTLSGLSRVFVSRFTCRPFVN
jgi:hypothetical protein